MVQPGGALKKGPWTHEEDSILSDYLMKNGVGNWNSVMRNSGLNRCGKSCRLRWTNFLRPNLRRGAFTLEEEAIIVHLHSKIGNKWAKMATQLPGRTDNEIKNFWNTRLKRKQRASLPIYPPIEETNPEIQNTLESIPSDLVSGSNISLYDIFDSSANMTTHPNQNYSIFNQVSNSVASQAFTFNEQLNASFNPQFHYTSSNFGFDVIVSGQTYEPNSVVYPTPIDIIQHPNLGLLYVNNGFSGDLYGESNARNTLLDPSYGQPLWDYNIVNNGSRNQQYQSIFDGSNLIPQSHILESSSSHSSYAASSMGETNGFLNTDQTIPLTGPTHNADGSEPNGAVNQNPQDLLNSSMDFSYWKNLSDLNRRFYED